MQQFGVIIDSSKTSEADTPFPPAYVATSTHLERILDDADAERITVGWLVAQLGERSFGLALLVMALIALVPGASTVVGILIAWPAIQMMVGHDTPILPRFLSRREIATQKAARAIRAVVPRLRWVERLIRPRWYMVFQVTRRLTGLLMLLLGLTMVSPFPFSHVIPALVIMLLALAYLENDGIALFVASVAALTSMAITAAALWGAVEIADWIDRLWPI